jgi:hypothetical protein
MPPTLAGFIDFLRNTVGISTTVLPDNSPDIGTAFAVALAIVNPALRGVCIPSKDSAGAVLNGGGLTIFALCVYNLGASNVFAYAQDLPGAAMVEGSGKPGLPFFQWSRKQWNVNGFVSGVISGSSDESTSQTLVVQEAAKAFTLANLQQLKDPYGRQYLAMAQSYGPSTWGLS